MKFKSLVSLIEWYIQFCDLQGENDAFWQGMLSQLTRVPNCDVNDLPGEDELIAKIDICKLMNKLTDREKQVLIYYAFKGERWACYYHWKKNLRTWHMEEKLKMDEPPTNGEMHVAFSRFIDRVQDMFIEADYLAGNKIRARKKFAS